MCTGPIDVIKGQKSKESAATVHWTIAAIPCCSWQKKREDKTQLTKCNAGFSAIQTGTEYWGGGGVGRFVLTHFHTF